MSLRLPQTLAQSLGRETGETVLAYELAEEQAHSLGGAGRRVEAALAALDGREGEGRAQALKVAADAVWEFLVQREILGLRDRAAVVLQYGIPSEVMKRLGAR